QIGTELDKATQAQLDRGERMVELLKQGQYKPMDVIDQVIQIFAAGEGFLDDVPVDQVTPFAEALIEHFHGAGKPVFDELTDKQSIKKAEGMADKLKAEIEKFKAGWSA
ncbi:MAG: F0F1 ATP synthase subunit alpha, partial [Pseudomonadota bacterium]